MSRSVCVKSIINGLPGEETTNQWMEEIFFTSIDDVELPSGENMEPPRQEFGIKRNVKGPILGVDFSIWQQSHVL